MLILMENRFIDRDVISINDFNRDDFLALFKCAEMMRDHEKSENRHLFSGRLKRRRLAELFYEPSTRTRTSFNTAITELGGCSDGFSGIEGTSVVKQESIRDTILMYNANHFDVLVMRHPLDGSVQWAADVSDVPVINGGDGMNEHPTQAMLDAFTLHILNDNRLDGIRVGLGGDLMHGRTIRSLSQALALFDNVSIFWAADDFFKMPGDLERLLINRGVKVERLDTPEDVLENCGFYYMTRPQTERIVGKSAQEVRELLQRYRITPERLERFKGKILHPLPINSQLAEIDNLVYYMGCQGFLEQAENGIFVRKALLYLMMPEEGYTLFRGVLNPEINRSNNRIFREVNEGGRKDGNGEKMVRNIEDGLVLDHLKPASAEEIARELMLVEGGYSCITASVAGGGEGKAKSFLKTNLHGLSERELKRIALISGEPTVNLIRNGGVAEKFVYLLCGNDNCVTRVVKEDVPGKFYYDGEIRCGYCRRPYAPENRKISGGELNRYAGSLPRRG